MSIKEIMEKERWATEEAIVRGNLNALDEAGVFDENTIYHIPPFPDLKGLEAFKDFMKSGFQMLSDIRWRWDEVIFDGNTAVQRFHMWAKHTGTWPMIPVPSSGKDIEMEGCAIYHVKNGKIVEFIEHSDYLGFFQQVGAIPPLG